MENPQNHPILQQWKGQSRLISDKALNIIRFMTLVAAVALIIWLFVYLRTGMEIRDMLKAGNVDEYCAMKYKPYVEFADGYKMDLSGVANIKINFSDG